MMETRMSTNRIEERDDRRAHLRKVAERLNLDCHEYAPTLRLL